MTDELNNPQFKDWLKVRMNAANLSQSERMQFLRWLVKRKGGPDSGGSEALKSAVKSTRLKEVKECFNWLKVRITDSDINERESKEFDLWMAKRVVDSEILDD